MADHIVEKTKETIVTATNALNEISSKTDSATTVSKGPLLERAKEYVISHSAEIISAVCIVIIGVLAARTIGRMTMRWLEKKDLEPPIRMLVVRVTRVLVFGLALMIALQTLGLNMMALIAGLGVAGVGIGFALQGVLGNLFAGLTIIFTKPFRVGEYIGIVGVEGVVSQIELINTTLLHADASRVVIPNHKIMGEILHNYGSIRQVDLNIGVGYTSDLNKVRAVIMEVLQNNPKILKEPGAVVAVGAFNDSSISIAIKPWVKLGDFGSVQTELNQMIIEKFRVAQIEVPFPQREVRILNPGALPNV